MLVVYSPAPRLFPPPVFDCHQYGTTCLRDLVTSGRQVVYTWGAVPNLNILISYWVVLGIVNDEWYSNCLLMLCPPALGLIVQEMAWRFFIGHCPPCVYPLPDVPTRGQISQAFSTHFRTAGNQIPEVGMAWERGYIPLALWWYLVSQVEGVIHNHLEGNGSQNSIN